MKKLNKLSTLGVIFITLLSCGFSTQKNNISEQDIIGTWILNNKQVNYPQLTFNADSTCIFTSMGDTLYRFKYQLKKDNLILEDILGTVKENQILKLTKNELVFKSLWENKTEQEYTKK